MSNAMYSNVQLSYNKILYRGYDKNGNRVQKTIDYSPSLYVVTQDRLDSTSLYGDNLKRITFEDIQSARSFIKEYKKVENQRLFGYTSFNYAFIAENFKGSIDFDFNNVRILSIDIETGNEKEGFPKPEEALEEVLLITVKDFHSKKVWTLGSRPSPDSKNYILCKDEAHLLHSFIRLIRQLDPDVITGWNINGFDIPYLGVRISRMLGSDEWQKISPWNKVRETETKDDYGNKHIGWDISGISVLDHMELYKKFTYTAREQYSLDHIAFVELNKNKLESGYDSFKEFYDSDWPKFVLYNQVDTDLVDDLEAKLGLIYLATALAYIGKVNYEDVYSPIKTWENLILSTLMDRNIYCPVKKTSNDDVTIAGAYVKIPQPGFYKWVCSADAASLYPSIAIALNLSPETILPGIAQIDTERFVNQGFIDEDITAELKKRNLSLAANGTMYRREKQGILPELFKICLTNRKTYKKQMLAAKAKYEETHDQKYKKEADKCHVMQLALKIFANSGYGALASKYFLFFDTRLAEGITLTGQMLIKLVQNDMNQYLNKLIKNTEPKDYAFYGDTDSVYYTLEDVVKNYLPESMDTLTKIKKLVEICDQKITKIINASCDKIHDGFNTFENSLEFKIEAVADSGIWVAKKRYALRYYYNEGVYYKEGDLKVIGLEIVKSSTPKIVREWLKECIPMMLDDNKQILIDYVDKCKSTFRTMNPEEIAFPRSANELKANMHPVNIYTKGTSIGARASILFNYHCKKLGIDKKYSPILEGSKMKFIHLKMPNRIHENVIAFSSNKLPVELGLHSAIDYDTQFEKAFYKPLSLITEAIGWELEEKATLDSFFV